MYQSVAARIVAVAFIVVLAFSPSAFAAPVDIYIEIEGIPGESRAVPSALEVSEYSHDIVLETGSTGGGGGAGKVNVSDIVIAKPVGKSTPKLMQACATGQHFPKATLSVRQGGGKSREYLVITMEDVIITSYQTGASSDEKVPLDQFSLNYSKINFSYRFGEEVSEIPIDLRSLSVE